MKRTIIPIIVVIVLLFLIIGGYFGFKYIERYIPTKERADIAEVLGVSGDQAAFFYNDERMTGVKVIIRDGQAYLPVDWVDEYVNEKFYWDDVEKMLVYTLPDTIVYAGKQTVNADTGKPLLLEEDDRIWLSAGLVKTYTDIRVELFTEPVSRFYLYDSWDAQRIGTAAKETPVRVRGGIKSPIMTTVPADGEFVLLEQGENWSQVRTQDGFIGWIQNKAIAEDHMKTLVSTFEEPEYTSLSMDEKVCLAWHQALRAEDNDKLEGLVSAAAAEKVNVIAPTWLQLSDSEGNYFSCASREYVDKAHEMGFQVWAVLDNFNYEGGKNVHSEILFAKTSARQKLIASLMKDAEEYDLDGINLDIEMITQEAMPHYVQFIRELSVACRNKKLFLSVDNHVPTSGNLGYNRAEQGRVVDYVIIMGYDEHYSGGEAGSTASYDFVKAGIEDTLREVPAEKVINAVPFYTRRWVTEDGKTTSTAMGLETSQKWVEDHDVQLYWQEALGQYYGELTSDTSYTQIWLEDERSMQWKIDMIRDYHLAGVACWKLELASDAIWDIVNVNE